jgi:hypothetical protein
MSVSKFSLSNDALFQKKSPITIGERQFYLNKSHSKFVSVGLNYNFNFGICISLGGAKCANIILSEDEFRRIVDNQGVILNSLYTGENQQTIDCTSFNLEFPRIYDCIILKIVKDNLSICFNYDTICNLFDILSLLEYHIDLLKKREFPSYYKLIQSSLMFSKGNLKEEAIKLLAPKIFTGNIDISLCLEFILMYPEVFTKDCSDVQL